MVIGGYSCCQLSLSAEPDTATFVTVKDLHAPPPVPPDDGDIRRVSNLGYYKVPEKRWRALLNDLGSGAKSPNCICVDELLATSTGLPSAGSAAAANGVKSSFAGAELNKASTSEPEK